MAANALLASAVSEWVDHEAPYGLLVTDADLRVQGWNRWLEKASGRPGAEVLGRSLAELFPELRERGLLEVYQKALLGEPWILSARLHRYLFRWKTSRRGGSEEVPMVQTARVSPLRGEDGEIRGTITIIEDVSEREQQAELLRRQHARQRILSRASEGLLLAGRPAEALRDIGAAVASFLQADVLAVYLRDRDSWHLLSAGESSDAAEKGARDLSAHAEALAELISSPSGDEPQSVDQPGLVCIPLDAGGGLLGALVLSGFSRESLLPEDRDLLYLIARYVAVTLDRASAADEIQRANDDLEHRVSERTSQLQESVGQLESFSYSVAHDLRAPLRAIKGYGEVLLQDFSTELPSAARNYLARIRIAAVKMELLTKDLLTFCQVSRQDNSSEPLDPAELVQEVRLLLPELQVPGVLSVARPLHAVVAPRGLLRQALMNLLENAVKFRHQDRAPRIVVRSEKLEASEPGGPMRVRLWVEDNGIGMESRHHHKIFSMFERLHAEQDYPGTGIGLAIVARSAKRMGGSCGVESAPGEGSRFWLDLPTS